MSDEQRAKLTGKVRTPEHCANIGAASKGRIPSAETRAKMSASHLGNKNLLGHKHSDETRAKISSALTGRPVSAEFRAKLGARSLGKTKSLATRAKISAAVRLADAEGRRHVVILHKFRYSSLARALRTYLETHGLVLEPEVRFGRFTVDLYDREHHVAYEADGAFWHNQHEARRPGYGATRDAYLVENYGLKVVHYTDKEISALTGWPKKRAVAA